ncbi:MAG: hypothetical protein JWM95_607 [Gemmatimonadetes bacterium]|nr:hypothetical protein [Gemmatimonadota bacterium]
MVHVIAPGEFGGLERVVESLAESQRARGRTVSVIALTQQGMRTPPLLAILRSVGIEVHEVTSGGRAYLSQARSIRALCARIKPTIVHSHGYLPDALVSFTLGDRYSKVTTVHGFTGGSLRNRAYERLQLLSFRRFDAVAVVSNALRTRLMEAGLQDNRITVIRNAWRSTGDLPNRKEARKLLGLSEPAGSPSETLVGWVGRVSWEKGLDVMVEALAQLRDLPCRLVILGDGPDLDRSRKLAQRLNVTEGIRHLGAIQGAGKLLRAFDLVALTSRTEGTPMILLEAMAAEVPIVATSVGGVPDVLTPGDARLVPSEDPVALAKMIRDILADGVSAQTRAGNARRRLANLFDTDSWIDAYDDLYARAGGH